jgi:hypothetical protein
LSAPYVTPETTTAPDTTKATMSATKCIERVIIIQGGLIAADN